MDVTTQAWIDSCAQELQALGPALSADAAAGIAREVWVQADDDQTPQAAALQEIRTLRPLTR